MSLIHGENFDASSSLPTDWNFGAAVFSVVNAEFSVAPPSAPNMLSALASSSGGPVWGNWNTGDGNGGNVTVQCWLDYHVSSGNAGYSGAFCRGSSATMTSADSAYVGRVNWNTGVPELGIFAAGSWTSLAIGDGLVIVPDGSNVYLTADGSTIEMAIRRPSDGYYLNSSDGWQSSPAYHLSATDSTLTGSGYSGVYAEPNGSTFLAFFDDFAITTPGLPTPGESGSLSATEAGDAASLGGSFTSSAMLAVAEHRDAGSIAGSQPVGTIAKTEGRDAASASASNVAIATLARAENRDAASIVGFRPGGSMAAAERGDVAAIGAGVPDVIMTTQEGGDSFAGAAVFASAGSTAVAEAGDSAAMHGFFPAGSLAATERGDIGSASGSESVVAGAIAKAEGGDVAAFIGAAPVTPYLIAVESGDVGSMSGSVRAPARMAAAERRDVASVAAGWLVHASSAAVERSDVGAITVHAEGIPPTFRVRERGDVGTITALAPALGLQYDIYMSPAVNDPIDYDTPVATTAGLSWSTGATSLRGADSGPFPAAAFPTAGFPDVAFAGPGKAVLVIQPGAIVLSVPGTWSFGMRAANQYGEEKNLDVAVSITFDASGRDISDIPAPPTGLRLIPTAGAGLTVLWQYPATPAGPKAPTGFHVYLGAGGTPDYTAPASVYLGGDASPITAVPYNGAIQGTWTVKIPSLADGTTYTVGVRAYNGTGEEQNQATASATAVGTGPLPVTGLSATAVV